MKHLINYSIAFSSMIALLITFLSLGVLILFLNLFQDKNIVHSVPTEQCNMETCIQPTVNDQNLKVELVTTDLNAPTNMVFLGNNDLLVLERYTGKVKRIINDTVQAEPLLDVNVANGPERGLLGITVSKQESKGGKDTIFVFLYYTETKSKDGEDLQGEGLLGNRLYRFELVDNKLINPKLLIDLPVTPGPNHNGGSVAIGPDNNVYLSIGDLDNVTDRPRPNTKTQNVKDGEEPNGSGGILRITQNGEVVDKGILGNSYPLNLYYGYGLRNSFGITFDPITGKLWDTENGPNYGDEINLVEPGFNGGWKKVQGIWQPLRENNGNIGKELDDHPQDLENFNGKGKYSDPEFIWKDRYGPTGLKFLDSSKLGKKYENDLFVGDVHKGNVYHFELNKDRTGFSLAGPLSDRIANNTEELKEIIFAQGFGVITDIEIGDDGYLYILSYVDRSIYRIVPNVP
jgi:glucose/arabinose dehydrogenase